MKKSVFAFITLFVITFISQTATAGVESIVLYLPFDEGSGDVVNDLSGNGNNGTIIGAKWVAGKMNEALEFDGASYVDIPNNDSLSLEKDITVMAWVFVQTGTSGEMAIVSKGQWAANDLPYELTVTPGANIYWQTYDDADHDDCDPPSPPTGEWHHIAATYDGASFKCYIDGEMKEEFAYTGTLPQNTANVTVGKRSKADECYLNGMIDEVAIYASALNDEEVNSEMNGITAAAVNAKEKLPALWGGIKAE